MEKVIIIGDEDKVYKVYVNHNLIKQLVLDSECEFYSFFKKSNKEFSIFSNLSFIKAKEKFLLILISFFDNETNIIIK